VNKVDIWHLKLVFLSPIRHSLATHEGSENLVVQVTTAEGLSGYGEGVPRVFVTGETLSGSLAFLKEKLAPAVLHNQWESPQTLQAALEEIFLMGAGKYPGAFCAMEMALLDAAGKTWGVPLADLIGPPVKDRVVYSAIIPLASLEKVDHFLNLVEQYQIQEVKLKVGTPRDLKILQRVRERLGWERDIRVDANSAWEPGEAIRRIKEMAPYRISAVEQPVAKEDFLGLKQVSDGVDLPIIADESLCREEDARRLIDLQACRIFNLRLSKCGGLGATRRIRQMAEQNGIACQLGCHVGETSILSAAGRAFALCSPHLAYLEGSFAPFLLTKDPVTQPVIFNRGGVGAALPGPGLGVEVVVRTLKDLARARYTVA